MKFDAQVPSNHVTTIIVCESSVKVVSSVSLGTDHPATDWDTATVKKRHVKDEILLNKMPNRTTHVNPAQPVNAAHTKTKPDPFYFLEGNA